MRKLIKLYTILSLVALGGCTVVNNSDKHSKVATIKFDIHKVLGKKKSPPAAKLVKTQKKKQKANNQSRQPKLAKSVYIRQIHKSISNFNKLLVDGNIDVELHSNFSKPSLIIKGDQRDIAALKTEVKDHTLVLYAGAGTPDNRRLKVIVKGRYINSINLKTNARIHGKAFKTSHLNLEVKDRARAHLAGYIILNQVKVQDQGSVKLNDVHSKHLEVYLKDKAYLEINGKANLAKLEVADHTHFSMTWINGRNLVGKVRGNAYVQLAGIVNKLDICVFDKAQWNGRYLRSTQTYVKTFDHALARISAVHKQHTLALGRSNIYFYNLSTYRTDFMGNCGSVLDMRDWVMRAWNDYDIYNKAA